MVFLSPFLGRYFHRQKPEWTRRWLDYLDLWSALPQDKVNDVPCGICDLQNHFLVWRQWLVHYRGTLLSNS